MPPYLLDTNPPKTRRNTAISLCGFMAAIPRAFSRKSSGIGGVKLLRALDESPSVFHMNEGHAAFLPELIRERMAAGDDFDAALSATREECIFTTHTPVLPGMIASPQPHELCAQSI